MISFLFRKTSLIGYFIATILLAFLIYAKTSAPHLSYTFYEQGLVFLILFGQMIAMDLGIKANSWSKKANDHLYFFPLVIVAIPWEEKPIWSMLYHLLFWLAFLQLTSFSRSPSAYKRVFNASFLFLTATLFSPQSIYFFPVLWFLLFVLGQFKRKPLLLSTLPFLAFYFLDVAARFFSFHLLPQHFPIPFSLHWPFGHSPIDYLWWVSLLLIIFFSIARHLSDANAKSAAYGKGLNALIIIVFFALLQPLVFTHDWNLLAIASTTLSSRFFEKIKKGWLRETVFLLLISSFIAKRISEYFT